MTVLLAVIIISAIIITMSIIALKKSIFLGTAFSRGV